MPRLEESDSGHNLHSSRSHGYRQPLSPGRFQVESHRAPPVQPNQQKLGWRTPHRHRQDPQVHPYHQNGIRPYRQCVSHPRERRHRNQDLRRGDASTQPRSPRNARALELYRTPHSECELILGHRLSAAPQRKRLFSPTPISPGVETPWTLFLPPDAPRCGASPNAAFTISAKSTPSSTKASSATSGSPSTASRTSSPPATHALTTRSSSTVPPPAACCALSATGSMSASPSPWWTGSCCRGRPSTTPSTTAVWSCWDAPACWRTRRRRRSPCVASPATSSPAVGTKSARPRTRN